MIYFYLKDFKFDLFSLFQLTLYKNIKIIKRKEKKRKRKRVLNISKNVILKNIIIKKIFNTFYLMYLIIFV